MSAVYLSLVDAIRGDEGGHESTDTSRRRHIWCLCGLDVCTLYGVERRRIRRTRVRRGSGGSDLSGAPLDPILAWSGNTMNGRLTLVACHGLLCWLLTWGLGQTNSAMSTRAIVTAVACVPVAPPCWTTLSASFQKWGRVPSRGVGPQPKKG